MFTKVLSHLRQQSLGALALFIVLGGTSYAVATGSIDSREIKNSTIRSKDIRNHQVTTSDVKNGSLLSQDFKPGQLPAGPQGPQGVQGARGPSGATNVTVRSTLGEPQASCLAGERAVGGGAAAPSDDDVLWSSRPIPLSGTPTGWQAGARDTAGGSVGPVTAYVICASP